MSLTAEEVRIVKANRDNVRLVSFAGETKLEWYKVINGVRYT